jgi:hypothetical protein
LQASTLNLLLAGASAGLSLDSSGRCWIPSTAGPSGCSNASAAREAGPRTKSKAALVGGLFQFQNLILKGHAFGVVFFEPFFRGVRGGKNLDVLGVANLLAGVDVDKSAASFRVTRGG